MVERRAVVRSDWADDLGVKETGTQAEEKASAVVAKEATGTMAVAIAAAGSRHRCPAAPSRSSTHDCSGLSWLTALPASRGTSMRQ